ncbi:MAG: EF-hand domain-containing protein [Alphaproteobacteria bacterium]|nr:EF-hand domain-containing protein [Alphaproteobacteria bacterium]
MAKVRFALMGIAAGVFAISTLLSGPAARADSAENFKATDLNKDGQIDREEFHRRRMDLYFLVDRNKDGVIVIGELQKVKPGDFNAADRNKDGKLSSDEYMNSYFLDFQAADTNKDGKLSSSELKRWNQGR